MISAIVCVDKNWGIGYQGELLAKIPEDMKFFHEKTKGSAVIMGRKTYDSLPNNKRPLPNRFNHVISREVKEFLWRNNKDGSVSHTLEDIKILLKTIKTYKLEKIGNVYVIGGGQIYKELLPFCEKVFVTVIDHEFENVDTYFSNLKELPNWYLTKIGEEKEYNGLKYRFNEYRKIDYKIIDVTNDWSDFTELVEIQLSDNTVIHVPIKYYFHGSKTVDYIGVTNTPLHFEVQENFEKFLVKLALYKQNRNKEV